MTAIFQNITASEAEEQAAVAAYEAERLAVYIARFGKDCPLARENALADARGKFRNDARGKAFVALFSAARAGGPDFILGGEG